MMNLLVEKLPLVVPSCESASHLRGALFVLTFTAASGIRPRDATAQEIAQAQVLVDQDAANDAAKVTNATQARQALAALQVIIDAAPVVSLLTLQAQVKDIARAVQNIVIGTVGRP